ncbi:MAG: hypothetical protein QXO03_00450 [Thermoplasmatales archaeon]
MNSYLFKNRSMVKFYLIFTGMMIANVVAAALAILYFWGEI